MRRAVGIALAGTALIFAALVFDASGLFVPGVAFVLLAAVMPVWIWAASRGAAVSRQLEEQHVVEDQPVEARIVVHRGPFGLPGGEVTDPFAGGTIRLSTSLGTRRVGRTSDLRVVARFPRRGQRRFDPPVLSLADPLGLIELRARSRSGSQSLLVLPRTEPIRWLRRDAGQRLDLQRGQASLDTLAATEIDGLRPYSPGTPASRISWPALARGAGLLERRLRAERESGALVVLDVRAPDDGEHVDAAVRAAASLTVELARRLGCELLLPGERRPLHVEPDLGGWPDTHARLAFIDGGPDAAAPSVAMRPRAGMIFYVAADAGRLTPPLLRGGQRAAVLVLPQELRPAVRCVPSFEVSGCRGYLLAASGRALTARERAA